MKKPHLKSIFLTILLGECSKKLSILLTKKFFLQNGLAFWIDRDVVYENENLVVTPENDANIARVRISWNGIGKGSTHYFFQIL